jgi:hypothetical protein
LRLTELEQSQWNAQHKLRHACRQGLMKIVHVL